MSRLQFSHGKCFWVWRERNSVSVRRFLKRIKRFLWTVLMDVVADMKHSPVGGCNYVGAFPQFFRNFFAVRPFFFILDFMFQRSPEILKKSKRFDAESGRYGE